MVYGVHGVYVDTTFDISELKLYLLTLLVTINGVGVSMGWIFLNSKEFQAYKSEVAFYNSVAGFTLQLEYVFANFEKTLRKAFKTAFPGTIVLGDVYHFLLVARKCEN